MYSAYLKKIRSNTRRKHLRCASESTLRNSTVFRSRLQRDSLVFACFKIDKAQRHQYWTFDVGRSMFDVQLSLDHVFSVIHSSDQAEFHTSTAAGLKNNQFNQNETFAM
jgi:hypothetical protein